MRDPICKLLSASEIILPCKENKDFHVMNFWGPDIREKKKQERLKKKAKEEEEVKTLHWSEWRY